MKTTMHQVQYSCNWEWINSQNSNVCIFKVYSKEKKKCKLAFVQSLQTLTTATRMNSNESAFAARNWRWIKQTPVQPQSNAPPMQWFSPRIVLELANANATLLCIHIRNRNCRGIKATLAFTHVINVMYNSTIFMHKACTIIQRNSTQRNAALENIFGR